MKIIRAGYTNFLNIFKTFVLTSRSYNLEKNTVRTDCHCQNGLEWPGMIPEQTWMVIRACSVVDSEQWDFGISVKQGLGYSPSHQSHLQSFGELASSPAIGLDLHVYHTQILIGCHILPYWETYTDEIRRCEESCDCALGKVWRSVNIGCVW